MYVYPKLSRAGLGNCLLPWARAIVFARLHGSRVLAPRWVQPRVGPLLRKEKVDRFYLNELTNASYLKGIHRFLLRRKTRQVTEEAFRPETDANSVVVFAGLKNYFTDIINDHEIVAPELDMIVASRIKRDLLSFTEPFIGM